MPILSKELLLGAVDVPTITVDIPELKGQVVVRGMTAKERTLFEKRFITESRGKMKRNFDDFREQLCVACVVEPKLTESDIAKLALVRADVIERITNVAMKLSGISEKDVEDLGLSSETPTASSTSSSPSPEN